MYPFSEPKCEDCVTSEQFERMASIVRAPVMTSPDLSQTLLSNQQTGTNESAERDLRYGIDP